MPLLVKKPISLLDKALTVAWPDVVKAIGKSTVHLATGKHADLLGDLSDLVAAVGLTKDVSEVAWVLIRRSLTRALVSLLRDSRDLFQSEPVDGGADVLDATGLGIQDEVLEIDASFFDDPTRLDLFERLKPSLQQWLIENALSAAAARAIAERLPPYFVLALHDEWMRSPADYLPLKAALDTPFTAAQDSERAWMRYEAHLWRIVNEPMFAEPFGLKTVFIPPRAYWEECKERASDDSTQQKKVVTRKVVDLARELNRWLEENRKDDSIRVLSGGPGSGKSSFTRMYAAETMARGHVRVLFVPLHLFDPKGDLPSAVGEYVRISRILPSNPLEHGPGEAPRRLLLVFDGLDELAMQGRLAAETAQHFVREVEKTVDRLNQMGPWLSVLISGRELVVQANANDFRRDGQILHLLSYAASDATLEADSQQPVRTVRVVRYQWSDPNNLLKMDQRAHWWKRYHDAGGVDDADIPSAFVEGELGQVTGQPLLLYLIALSYARKRLVLSATTNLNAVYEDLIDAVWERGYEKNRPFSGIKNLKREEFIRNS